MKSLVLTAQDAREFGKLGGLTITKPIKPTPPPYIKGASIVEQFSGKWLITGPDGGRLAAHAGVTYSFDPPAQVGDAVFIREPWYRLRDPEGNPTSRVILAADSSVPEGQTSYKWASPVSMPEDAARRFARVVSVAAAYGEGVSPVWLVELEAIEKVKAVTTDADVPFSTADNPEDASTYYTYAGDMSAEDHEKMIAAIDGDRARLSEVQDRVIGVIARNADECSLGIEDALLSDELDELTAEEGNLRASLEDAGAPVQTIEERARERLDELEKRGLEIAHSIADTRAGDACGTPAELSEIREALTREAEQIAEEEREIAAYLSTVETSPEDAAPITEKAPSAGNTGESSEEVGSFNLGKCKYCGREWGVTLEGAAGGGYPTQRTADAAATRLCDCEEATVNRAPIYGVSLAVTAGACRYCGQMQTVGPHPSQKAADETATEVCNCPEARSERRVHERIEDARERVTRLFGDGSEALGFKPIPDDAVGLLERVVEMIARGPISSASLNVRGQCKAKFSVTSKGKIKVSRSETRSCDLEDGE